MQAAVKTRRTKLRIEGDIPPWLLDELKKRYPGKLELNEDPDDEGSINIRDSEWFKGAKVTPAKALRLLRQNRGLSQEALAGKLGPAVRKTHVSDMELGRRGISKSLAKRLAAVLETSALNFI